MGGGGVWGWKERQSGEGVVVGEGKNRDGVRRKGREQIGGRKRKAGMRSIVRVSACFRKTNEFYLDLF